MPRTNIGTSAVRDPRRLTSVINELQRQISANRVAVKKLDILENRINALEEEAKKKRGGRPKKTVENQQ